MDNGSIQFIESRARVEAFGEAGIARLVAKFSGPMILSTTVDAAYNIVDRIFVGRACGEDALAAVTVCFAPQMFFLAFGMIIGHGSGTVVSILLGRKDNAAAEKCLGQTVFLFSFLCLFMVCALLPFMDEFLRLFGAAERILPMASQYYTIIVSGLVFEKISYGIGNLVRAEGRPFVAMGAIIVGGAANVVLDYLFLFEFGFGIRGAAFATVVAQAVGASVILYFYLFSKRNFLKLRLSDIRPRKNLLKAVVSAGSPSFAIQILGAFSMSVLILQSKNFGGDSAIAVVGVISSVQMMLVIPVVGMSMGIQPILGYNWGAGKLLRVRRAYFVALGFALAVCVGGCVGTEVFAREIFVLFLGADSPLIDFGCRALRIIVAMLPFAGFNIVTSGYFQSTKRPKFAILITTIRQIFVLVPMFLLLPNFFGIDGIWLSFPVSDFAATGIVAFFALREIRKLRSSLCAH